MTVLRTSSSVSAEIGSVHLTQEGRVASTSRGNLFRFSLVTYGASSFNQPLNNWDVSNVEDMREMFTNAESFEDATSFNQPLNNWDVSNVKDMGYMFYHAESNSLFCQ